MELNYYACATALDGKEYTSSVACNSATAPMLNAARAVETLCKKHNTSLLNDHAKKMIGHVMIFRQDNTDMTRWDHQFGDYNTFYVRILDAEGVALANEYFHMLNDDGRTKTKVGPKSTAKDLFSENDVGSTVQFCYDDYECYHVRNEHTIEEQISTLKRMRDEMTCLSETTAKHLYISITPKV